MISILSQSHICTFIISVRPSSNHCPFCFINRTQIGSDLDIKSVSAKSEHLTDNSTVDVGKVDEGVCAKFDDNCGAEGIAKPPEELIFSFLRLSSRAFFFVLFFVTRMCCVT